MQSFDTRTRTSTEVDQLMSPQTKNPIQAAVCENPSAEREHPVKTRGRPERDPVEAARRILRRQHFGSRLRELREGAGLTLSGAAVAAGMSSPRKLSQYESTCYPPGDVVVTLAPLYGVTEKDLADLVLSHSDPALFTSMTGRAGFEPSAEAISDFLTEAANANS